VGVPKDRALPADALQRLSPGVLGWIEGDPLNQMEQSLGGNPETASGKPCPRARTLATSIVPLGLSFIAGLVARAVKGLVGGGHLNGISAPVVDCMATAVRRGFDSPVKIAFAELRTGMLIRVDVHNAFAAQVGNHDIIGDTDDFGALKD
jgi:hypothetical protein